MAQVNFTITDELKSELDRVLEQSGAESKPAFLQQMVNAFKIYQANNIDIDIDLSKYDSVNSHTKEALSDAFKHILTTLDANFSTAKQEAVYIAAEKKALVEKEEAFEVELLRVSADARSEISLIKAENKELVADTVAELESWKTKFSDLEAKKSELKKEFANVSKVADQVQFISNENKELRDVLHARETEYKTVVEDLSVQLKSLTGELAQARQSLFKLEIRSESKDKEIATLTDQLSAEKEARTSAASAAKSEYDDKINIATKELGDVKEKYNRAVGKLEILEKNEK